VIASGAVDLPEGGWPEPSSTADDTFDFKQVKTLSGGSNTWAFPDTASANEWMAEVRRKFPNQKFWTMSTTEPALFL
jgi:hypothetical protein